MRVFGFTVAAAAPPASTACPTRQAPRRRSSRSPPSTSTCHAQTITDSTVEQREFPLQEGSS
jgi:hypothetical protein